eukprot:648143-Prorocentrum_minimum.AAC.1
MFECPPVRTFPLGSGDPRDDHEVQGSVAGAQLHIRPCDQRPEPHAARLPGEPLLGSINTYPQTIVFIYKSAKVDEEAYDIYRKRRGSAAPPRARQWRRRGRRGQKNLQLANEPASRSVARAIRATWRRTALDTNTLTASDWSVGRIYPRFLRLIGPSGEYTHASCVRLVRRENIPTLPASDWSELTEEDRGSARTCGVRKELAGELNPLESDEMA